MRFRQYDLRSGEGPEIVRLRTWLPEPRLHWGTKLTLKGSTEVWEVVTVFDEVVELRQIERTWHNSI